MDALLVSIYSLDEKVVLPVNGDISLGDVNGDGQIDFSDAWLIYTYLRNPSHPSLPPGIGELIIEATASLSPDPATVAFMDDGIWHRFTVESPEVVSVVVSPGENDPGMAIAVRRDQQDGCSQGTNDQIARESGQSIYLSGCIAGTETVESRRAADSRVLQAYEFEVSVSPADLVVESIAISDSSLTPGQSLTLTVSVRNQGTDAARATTLHYYVSSAATISRQDKEVGTGSVDSLAAKSLGEVGPSSTPLERWSSTLTWLSVPREIFSTVPLNAPTQAS